MNAPTIVARLSCDEPTARRLAAYLGETLDAADSACAFEDNFGHWQVAIHFRNAPDEVGLRDLVKLAAGKAAAEALSIERIPGADWVARSLAGLRPVRAGRFIVHGAHDRAGLRANDIGIEIEAALAFGTGHHGTTRGCLLALADLTKRRRIRNVLDIGTGSGVLQLPRRDCCGRALLPAISTRWRCALPGTTPGRTTRYRWSPSRAPPVSALKQFARVDPTT